MVVLLLARVVPPIDQQEYYSLLSIILRVKVLLSFSLNLK
jgi:hypothetical protein